MTTEYKQYHPSKSDYCRLPIFFFFLVLLLTCHSLFGQVVTYNHIADAEDSETQEVMTLFENYIASAPQENKANPYWNQEEQEKHKHYDFLESEFQPSLYMGFPVHVLSIQFNDRFCQIKAQFSYCQEDGSPYILATVNYHAKKENGKYKLYNALPYNRKFWKNRKVGLVDFYYPPYHEFNLDKANKLNDFIHEICSNFDVEPTPFEYYLADTYDEIQHLKGFDYYLGMGGTSKPSGKATDDKVYCGGLGEYYPHEVVHLQIDEHYPNKHFWITEGLATYLGGSRGQTLEWHLEKTGRYLKDHPEIDLNNMLELTNLDDETAYHYVLGGLIVKRVCEKGGWELLKDFMNSGTTDDNYYQAIERFLGVKRIQLNEYLREELKSSKR